LRHLQKNLGLKQNLQPPPPPPPPPSPRTPAGATAAVEWMAEAMVAGAVVMATGP